MLCAGREQRRPFALAGSERFDERRAAATARVCMKARSNRAIRNESILRRVAMLIDPELSRPDRCFLSYFACIERTGNCASGYLLVLP
jgi:hypothetical protein